jgi:hypothetical protein
MHQSSVSQRRKGCAGRDPSTQVMHGPFYTVLTSLAFLRMMSHTTLPQETPTRVARYDGQDALLASGREPIDAHNPGGQAAALLWRTQREGQRITRRAALQPAGDRVRHPGRDRALAGQHAWLEDCRESTAGQAISVSMGRWPGGPTPCVMREPGAAGITSCVSPRPSLPSVWRACPPAGTHHGRRHGAVQPASRH